MSPLNKKLLGVAMCNAINPAAGKTIEAKNSISSKGELLLYGLIGDWWDGLDALSIVQQLDQLPGNEIVVRIQSPGGSVTEGLAMFNNLKQSAKTVKVFIDGIAASMASVIAMAGDVISIPSNALYMLHKPSAMVAGNANELRDYADNLDVYEGSLLQIYSDRTGKTIDEMKAFLADGKDHYFRGQEAIDFGLADQLTEIVKIDAKSTFFASLNIPDVYTSTLFLPTAAAAVKPTEENEMIRIKAKKGGWHFVPAINAALNGSYAKIEDAVAALKSKITVANLASILDGTAECDDATLAALGAEFGIKVEITNASSTAAVVVEPVAALDAAGAVAAERNRVKDLRAIAAQARVSDEITNAWIDSGMSVVDARAKALEVVAERDKVGSPSSHIRTGGSVDREGLNAAMVNALLHRIEPGAHKLTDNGRDFRGMTIVNLITASLEAAGQSVRGKTPTELVAMAMHTTSDFPIILQNVADTTLRAAYAAAPSTFKAIARATTANDFRKKYSVAIGGGSELLKVNEAGEFKEGTVTEGGESYKLDTFGRIFNFSRQLLINDDIGALTSFMASVGNLAGRNENKMVWNMVKNNPNLSDGLPVYSTNAKRKNLISGAAIDESTLSAGRMAMRQMVGLDGEPISVAIKYLAVGSARETSAEKILTPITPNATSGVNIFSNKMGLIVEPLLDGVTNDPFYGFADPAVMPAIEYAYLAGESGPYTETKWGFEVDGLQLKVRSDFGAGYVDYRPTVKFAGA